MAQLDCTSCAAQYPIEAGIPILLPPGMTSANSGDAALGDAVSRHPYSPKAQGIIDKCCDQWVLDLGAGGKLQRIDHVVQVDIFPYPMVDVVASADRLPFRAGVFGAVLSQAVFEHLQFPESAAGEIRRILKPGGIAKIDTAFLQPEHGYPYHFFNATESGLRHWFRDFQITWSGVEPYQHPKWALHWFTGVYLDALKTEHRQMLGNSRVVDVFSTLDRVGKGQHRDGDKELLASLDAIPGHIERALAAGVSIELVAPFERSQPLVKFPSASVLNTPEQWRIIELESRVSEVAKDRDAQAKLLEIERTGKAVTERTVNEVLTGWQQSWVLAQDARRLLQQLPVLGIENVKKQQKLPSRLIKLAHRLIPSSIGRQMQRYVGSILSRNPTDQSERLTCTSRIFVVAHPLTVQEMLYQFFSLVRQTYSGWIVLFVLPSFADELFNRVACEIFRLDRRVLLSDGSKSMVIDLDAQVEQAANRSFWRINLLSKNFLSFDAIEELVTLVQYAPFANQVSTNCIEICERKSKALQELLVQKNASHQANSSHMLASRAVLNVNGRYDLINQPEVGGLLNNDDRMAIHLDKACLRHMVTD